MKKESAASTQIMFFVSIIPALATACFLFLDKDKADQVFLPLIVLLIASLIVRLELFINDQFFINNQIIGRDADYNDPRLENSVLNKALQKEMATDYMVNLVEDGKPRRPRKMYAAFANISLYFAAIILVIAAFMR